jgi:tetratricopeptide (TPR) repeat protein
MSRSVRFPLVLSILLSALLLTLPPAGSAAVGEWERLDAQAVAQYRSGDYDDALVTARRALDLAENGQAAGVGVLRLASSLNTLALVHQAQGNLAEAQDLLERALAVSAPALPAGHPNVAALRANLAGLQEAVRQREVEQVVQRAQALNEQGLAHHERGEYEQAAAFYEEALPVVEQRFGADSAEAARVLASLADTHAARKAYPRAEALYRQALDIYARQDSETVARGSALNALAVVHYLQRQYGKAEPLFRESLSALEAAFGTEHPELLPVIDNLIALHLTTQRARQAQPFIRRAAAIREAHGID